MNSVTYHLALLLGLCIVSGKANGAEVPRGGGSGEPGNASLTELLSKLEQGPSMDLRRDRNGNVVDLTLRQEHAQDKNLRLISRAGTIRSLRIQGRSQLGGVTREGVRSLAQLTNLVTLRVCCLGEMQAELFEEICRLKGLQYLGLASAYPPESAYGALTNLQALSELHVTYCTNFGDRQLRLLTNMLHLKSLTIDSGGITEQGTNFLRQLRSLENVVLR